MSTPQKKIKLLATSLEFNDFTITYKVKPSQPIGDGIYPVYCVNDIKNKDLIMKPTLIDKDNLEVIFTPNNVTPLFYLDILDKKMRDHEEYKKELKDIYLLNQVVAYILI